jgi:hypothetical protein
MKKLLFLFALMLIALLGCESMLTDNPIDQPDFYGEENESLNEHKDIIEIHSDRAHYNSFRHLSETADDIVMGTIVDSRVDELFIMYYPDGRLSDEGLIFTIYTLQILDVYKGIHQFGDYIEIKQMGGETDRFIYVTNEPALNKNENYVFFLSSFDYVVPACYLNPYQGIYYFDVTNRDSSLKLANVSMQGNFETAFEITYGQLHSIDGR